MKLTKSHVSSTINDLMNKCHILFWSDKLIQPYLLRPDSASMGSDCNCCCGCAVNGHLLLLYNQKMLLQEEEKQEGEEGQGWLQHEKHAGRRGISPQSCMLKNTQIEQLVSSLFQLLITHVAECLFVCQTLTKFDLLPADFFLAQAIEDTRRALFPSIY